MSKIERNKSKAVGTHTSIVCSKHGVKSGDVVFHVSLVSCKKIKEI
jgi:hypothetical protein